MTWYNEAVFYHIYPLGLAGAPKKNDHRIVHRLNTLVPWIAHMKETGFNALYIGPLFESSGHGYETSDYRKLDARLGTNEDLKNFVRLCHESSIKVIFDGVFNHTGREFFAFKDLLEKRENSPYVSWYCNVNFFGNNEFNDGFSYDSWGGYNIMAKLNQRNPKVQAYIADTIRFWVKEFDVDGIRLDAADVLDFDFMKMLRRTANEVKEDFWLMGEVIHGEYNRWVNPEMLHSVTNYALHKALYSGHNEHNYFEIAHTVKRLNDMSGNDLNRMRLYNFADNHDVERIYSKIQNKAHLLPLYVLLYTLPGIPSVYYGSEFAIAGVKERWSDDSLRPCLSLENFRDNEMQKLVAALGKIHQEEPALSYGNYREILLTTRQYAFVRDLEGYKIITAVNNDEKEVQISLPEDCDYTDALSGMKYKAEDGRINITLAPAGAMILIPAVRKTEYKPVEVHFEKPEVKEPEIVIPENADLSVPYEEMTVEQLQAAILAKMKKNGPVSEQMKKDVMNNIWRDSLLNWIRSFR